MVVTQKVETNRDPVILDQVEPFYRSFLPVLEHIDETIDTELAINHTGLEYSGRLDALAVIQ